MTRVHDVLDVPPCPTCAAETVSAVTVATARSRRGALLYEGVSEVPLGFRYCGSCGLTFDPRLAVVDGPAGHWYAYDERHGELVALPQMRDETAAPVHPNLLAETDLGEWLSPEVLAPAARCALLFLLGRDFRETVEVAPH